MSLLLNNDGHMHVTDYPVVNLVPLNPGYYPMKIQYYQKSGYEEIVFGYILGNQKPMPIPKEILFSKD